MLEQQENLVAPTVEVGQPVAVSESVATVEGEPTVSTNGHTDERWQARAGRQGARRVHQLIQEGRLYEQEHGLKRGRQRLRQLLELGKLYEQEHGLRPARAGKRRQRLSHAGRQELLVTLLDCLVRIAKPSFRKELTRLVEMLGHEQNEKVA